MDGSWSAVADCEIGRYIGREFERYLCNRGGEFALHPKTREGLHECAPLELH